MLDACSRAAVQTGGGCPREIVLELPDILQTIQLPQAVLGTKTYHEKILS